MVDPQTAARGLGIAIEVADLGDWGAATLVSEYDPAGPAIRINSQAIERYRSARGGIDSCDLRAFIDLAVAHELYHHGESTGEIERLPTREEREEGADRYARARVGVDALLDAFVKAAL